MQIKTTKRYHCTPIRRAKIQNMGDPKRRGDVEPRGHSFIVVGL